MKTILFALFIFLFLARPVFAQDVSSSPHLIINFAAMNDLDWGAREDVWQTEVKPKVESQIRSMRETLSHGDMDHGPVLTWSTLMEYMNFSIDTPSENSVYAIKMRRILEIAEDLDFPVFVPLNGFQWWDQLPELYNWWDPDGTRTDPKFFARQKNPEEFKARFIAGFDPDNDRNVEWQSLRTPMKLGYRNWGGGGFRLAPPPNLLSRKYQSVQQSRLKVIIAEISKKQTLWKSQGKEYLFAGVSIGTEISLNASVTPADEFKPYGYRSMRDLGCEATGDSCRTIVLQRYLETTSQYVHRLGVPKADIYTHVYGEADSSDSHYAPYALSAFNLYSNPGSSFYGHKDDPLASPQWNAMIQNYKVRDWGAIEYSDTPTASGLIRTVQSAKLVDIYNWDSVQNNKSAVGAIKSALVTAIPVLNAKCQMSSILHIQSGPTAHIGNEEITVATTSALPPGVYSTFTESDCGNGKKIYSAPEIVFVPIPIPPDTTPAWVRWMITVVDMMPRWEKSPHQ